MDPSNHQYVPLSDYDWRLTAFGLIPWNATVYCLITSFFSVALWLSLELMVQVWFMFKRHTSLYYWSILITTWGIIGHTVAFTLKLFVPNLNAIGTTFLAKISWVANTTGFSVVLYSRLGLVLRSSSKYSLHRAVLMMIIIDAIIFHIPIIVFSFGTSTPAKDMWIPYMEVMERIQVIGFTLQEFCISSIYTYTTASLYKFITPGELSSNQNQQLRNVLVFLILAQTAVFCSDMAMLVVDFLNMFTLKACMHPFVYAVKLKIEFVVLNQLRSLSRNGLAPGNIQLISYPGDNDKSDSNSASTKSPTPLSLETTNTNGLPTSQLSSAMYEYKNGGGYCEHKQQSEKPRLSLDIERESNAVESQLTKRYMVTRSEIGSFQIRKF
jgi:hypothetical protein